MLLSVAYRTFYCFLVITVYQLLYTNFANGLCFGVLCTISPFVAKTCCENYNRCCLEFQEWLMPLLTMPEGPVGGQYPGPIGVPGGFGYNGLMPSISRRNQFTNGPQQPGMMAQSSSQPQPSQVMPTLSSPMGMEPWLTAANNKSHIMIL